MLVSGMWSSSPAAMRSVWAAKAADLVGGQHIFDGQTAVELEALYLVRGEVTQVLLGHETVSSFSID